ncbi:uncharacterized protein HMPREF1541_08925 [Cyphellophora europaea CBS 101466]|uniref:RxLR effector protein n=1 Tax=Cyphellophora europaea (strain CBS 101466) TaxID=1220924 RepID=W2RJH4_CYPE1|nr:uncharacterized protein HMPREF1541_08925 [Cyphellophora europaea CBS 101466]ETN36647.1 hypothetical protein HMPREF1541_08925 [Cyphellophora europaea CBS 101466]
MKVVSILSAALLATSVAATPMSITAASALASAQQVAQVVEAEPTGHVLQRREDGLRVQNPPAGKDLGDYIRELLSQNGRKAEEATAALLVDRKDFALREKVLAELIKPLKADRQAKLDRWLEDLRKE